MFLLEGPQPMLAGIFIEYQRGERLVATKANRILAFLRTGRRLGQFELLSCVIDKRPSMRRRGTDRFPRIDKH